MQAFRQRDFSLLDSTSDVTQFWEESHKAQAHLWLTGSVPDEVVERLGLLDSLHQAISSGASVLDVGVGEGQMGAHLRKLGAIADALDISEAGLARVSKFYRETFSDSSLLKPNQYSVILHHLVAQHMSHDSLTTQLTHLLDSLRVGGVLGIQYSSDRNSEEGPDDPATQKQGGVQRGPKWFESRIDKQKFEISADLETEFWDQHQTAYRVIRISRSA